MDKLLTISIAAYNVENFIENTLSSFVCSEETMKLIEIIIVNDGSTDQTSRIAQKYVDRYPSTFILINKENGNYGSTINKSLEVATGKYFKLVDGDDWVRSDDLTILVNNIKTIDADMIVTKYCCVSDVTGEEEIIDGGFTYDGKTYQVEILNVMDAIAMHFITFKTSILKKHAIHITEKCLYTDVEYILKPIPYVNTVAFIDACVYMYRIGRDGQSVSLNSWQRNLDMALKATFSLVDFWNEIIKNPDVSEFKKEYIFNRILGTVRYKYRIFLSFQPSKTIKQKLIDYDKKLKSESLELYNACNQRKEVKLLRLSHFSLYRMLSSVYRRHLKKNNEI